MDFRVSVLPTLFGEKVVLRLLDSHLQLDRTDARSATHEALGPLQDALAEPHGLVLVTGPTGSGKTTTLYSALAALEHRRQSTSAPSRTRSRCNLHGVNQVQMHDDVGLTFAAALRAFLRQDPDVIMVGEIRDLETADIAVKAALTGHLVLSTLHTNDAPSAVTRLLDMGIPPFLVAGSLRARRGSAPGACRLRSMQPRMHRAGRRPSRCRLARGTVQSAVEVAAAASARAPDTAAARPSTSSCRSATCSANASLQERARSSWGDSRAADGMRTLRQSALALAAGGITSLEEVLRVTPADADETC